MTKSSSPSGRGGEKRAALTAGYRCSICHKHFPSPEAGNAHLTKRHSGGGYLTWKAFK